MALIIISNIHSEILFNDNGSAEGWPLTSKAYPSLRARLDSFGFEVPYSSEI